MAKKSEPKGMLMTVKGLNKLVASTHQATVGAAKAVRKALSTAGVGHLHVVIPGEKNQIKMPNFKKRPSPRSRE